jgi:phage-related protein (TIGR01555 family)
MAGKNKLSNKQFQIRADSYINTLAGISGKSDKTRHTVFGAAPILQDEQLTQMYLGDGFAKKIVTKVADDMTRNWITIENDEENQITKELKRLKSQTAFNEAIDWQRLYRGGIIVMGLMDGRKLWQPINKNNIRGIEWLKVYSAARINIDSTMIVKDSKSEYYEDVEIFNVRKITGSEIKIHRSRCLVFKGEPVPDTSRYVTTDNLYWGMSALQSIFNQVKNYGATEQGVVNLLLEAVIGIFKLHNLPELLSEGNEERFYTIMETINASKSLINSVMLGPKDEFDRNAANMSGIPDIIDRFQMNLSAVTGIPVTLLFGRSPAGQNATGDSDLRNYYDMIDSRQEVQMRPPLQKLINIINGYLGVLPEDEEPMFKFNPVWTPTAAEIAETKNKEGQTQQKDVELGIIDVEESRDMRYSELEKRK